MFSRLLLTIFLLVVITVVAAGQTSQLVNIGGHRLDVVRAGSAGPAIIFEAGLGSELDTWEKIWPAIAEFSTVVAYSRSGLGKSELGARDHTAKSAVIELHALLAKLQLKPPYV